MRRPPLSLLVAYAVVGLFIVAEGRLRRGHEAKTLVAGAADEGTTRLIGASFGAALAGTPLLSALPVGRLPLPGRVGPVLMALGLGPCASGPPPPSGASTRARSAPLPTRRSSATDRIG